MAKTNRLLSVLCIALAAMLIFTALPEDGTFAWFAEKETDGQNVITSGTLKAALSCSDKFGGIYTDASKDVIFDYDRWEPGYTAVKYLKVTNAGTLAFQYTLTMTSSETAAGGARLSDVIDVYVGNGAVSDIADFVNMKHVGTLSQVMENINGVVQGSLTADASNIYCIVLHMQESAGNEYQYVTIGDGVAVQLIATQDTV